QRRLERTLAIMLDESEFLSPYGIRSVSRVHADHPFVLHIEGIDYSVSYDAAESTSGLFGGNSNWRGPVWFPANYLVIEALRRYANFYGQDLLVEHPTGSGTKISLDQLADDLSRRLVRLFLVDEQGRRPVFGDTELFQTDP